MRRIFLLIGVWFVLAGVTTVAFGGGPLRVKVSAPETVVAGQPYAVNLLVMRYGRKLTNANATVTIRYAGGSFTYRTTNAGHDGIYRVRVRVPMPGTWQYDVKVNGKLERRGTLAAKLTSPQG